MLLHRRLGADPARAGRHENIDLGLALLGASQAFIVGFGLARLPGAVHDGVDQPGRFQPVPHLRALEAQPDIGHFIFHPFVGVGVQVGEHQPPARAQHAHHLLDGRQRVAAVVQVHIGKNGIQAAIRQGQGQAVGFLEDQVGEPGQILARHLQHGRGAIQDINLFDQRGQPGGHKAGARADIRDYHLRAQVGFADGGLAHFFGKVAGAEFVPLFGDIRKIFRSSRGNTHNLFAPYVVNKSSTSNGYYFPEQQSGSQASIWSFSQRMPAGSMQ